MELKEFEGFEELENEIKTDSMNTRVLNNSEINRLYDFLKENKVKKLYPMTDREVKGKIIKGLLTEFKLLSNDEIENWVQKSDGQSPAYRIKEILDKKIKNDGIIAFVSGKNHSKGMNSLIAFDFSQA